MMTQSVRSSAATLIDSATANLSVKDRSGISFEQMIAVQSSPRNSDGEAVSRPNATSSKSNRADGQSKDKELTGKVDRNQEAGATAGKPEKLSATEQTAKAESPDTAKLSNPKDKEAKESDPELMAQIAGLLQQILDAVKSALQLSEEELNQLLEAQGMSPEDLLLSENLQQLILANSGQTNLMAVLTDEDLANQMSSLLKTVEEMKASSDLGLTPQQLQELVERIKASKDAVEELPLAAQELIDGNKVQRTDPDSRKVVAENKETISSEKAEDGSGQKYQAVTPTVEDKNASTSEAQLSDTQNEADRHEQQDAKAAEQFEAFLNNLTAHSTISTQTDANGEMVRITELRNIANQIIDHIKIKVQPNQSSMQLQLNPEHLGRVNLTVASKSGIMTAQFVVENEISKEAIESQLQVLRDALNQQGLKVENIEVTVMENGLPQYDQEQAQQEQETGKNNNRQKISLEDAMKMSEGDEELASADLERTAADTVGTLVDYTA